MNVDYSAISQNDISLRDYQQEAKNKIFALWDSVDNVLFQMPTGTGKTRLFTSIIRDINLWGLRNQCKPHILIIAHRSELIEQISRSLSKYHIDHGIFAGIRKEERDFVKPVQVASVQTITHGNNSHVAEMMFFDYIIIDEAHHATANSYQKLWILYPTSKKLGVTATPWRMNKGGFSNIFDTFLPSMQVREFMKKGWLAPYQYYSIPTNSNISTQINNIKETDIEGDYKISALEKVVNTDHIRAQLLNSYLTYAMGKKGIIYSISRTHSEYICAKYRTVGVSIVNIDSMTPATEREQYIEKFKKGEIDVIVNVDIFSEGFDCPDIEFVQLARPTKSLVKYIQQVGRGLRKNGNKCCVILDNVGLYNRFGLPDADRNWNEFFIGEYHHDCPPKVMDVCREIGDIRERDISEGAEEMILVSGAETTTDKEIIPVEEEQLAGLAVAQEDDVAQHEEDISMPKVAKSFCIESNPIFAKKYVVEENNDGYYFVNKKNGNRIFLVNHPSSTNGTISLRKESKDIYNIVREVTRGRGIPPRLILIGSIVREGLLKKFISTSDISIPLYI